VLGTSRRVLLVTDENVLRLGYAGRVVAALEDSECRVDTVVLPAGEATKSPETLMQLWHRAVACGLERGDIVAGVGGGVIGDIAGMLAATYMRGIALVLVPTTLLAQVDAAIGGKVGIDFAGVKNALGAFHPARSVLIDPAVLSTLPRERVAEGAAEMIKIAVMFAEDLFADFERIHEVDTIVERTDLIRRSAALKAEIVSRDPTEHGVRRYLNFGHTIGHGIEAASGYRLAHGAAVAIGMLAEMRMAVMREICPPSLEDRLRMVLDRLALPGIVKGLNPELVYQAMLGDKKRSGARFWFAVPATTGGGTLIPVSDDDARLAIAIALGRNEWYEFSSCMAQI
jgi:3-dehydroquinate synthase